MDLEGIDLKQQSTGALSHLSVELGTWRTMHDAPKTGQVLVYDNQNEQFYVAHWGKYDGVWYVGVFGVIGDENRLLWQPLPDKPTSA